MVLAVPSLEGMNPFADAPTLGLDNRPVVLEQLQTAINAVNNIPDVDTFDNLYYDYIKRDDVTDLGYYSKDNWPLPMAIEVRTERLCDMLVYGDMLGYVICCIEGYV